MTRQQPQTDQLPYIGREPPDSTYANEIIRVEYTQQDAVGAVVTSLQGVNIRQVSDFGVVRHQFVDCESVKVEFEHHGSYETLRVVNICGLERFNTHHGPSLWPAPAGERMQA